MYFIFPEIKFFLELKMYKQVRSQVHFGFGLDDLKTNLFSRENEIRSCTWSLLAIKEDVVLTSFKDNVRI